MWSLHRKTRLNLKMKGIAALYKTNGAPKQFLPIGQRRPLTPEVKSSLERYRLAFEAVPAEKIDGFDDMVSLYTNEIQGRYSENDASVYQPIFITSDFVFHAKHVIFDESLQLAEQNFFIPKLGNLVDGFLAALQKVNTAESKSTAGNETLQKARDYFNVAKALIEMTTKSGADVLAHYNETVNVKLNLLKMQPDLKPPRFLLLRTAVQTVKTIVSISRADITQKLLLWKHTLKR